jgi:hypothetical protein
MTWEGYFLYKLLSGLATLVLMPLFYLLVALSDSRYCRQCGRSMQWRWRAPSPYQKRRYCVFCED